MDVRNNKQRHYFEFISHVFKLTLLFLLLYIFIYSLNHLKFSNYFPIKTVKVYGMNHIENQEMHDILFPLVNNGFFSINVEAIRDRLLQLPWISQLYVRRIWPDQVEVTVIEKNPIALWNKESLLSESGEVFSPQKQTYPLSLPQLKGPLGQQMIMLNHFNNINRLLLPLHAKISYLELTPYFTWKLTLNNGIVIHLGYKDILTRLNQFVKVYPKIVGARAADVDYVDLRYSNGVAVRWKESLST